MRGGRGSRDEPCHSRLWHRTGGEEGADKWISAPRGYHETVGGGLSGSRDPEPYSHGLSRLNAQLPTLSKKRSSEICSWVRACVCVLPSRERLTKKKTRRCHFWFMQ